MPLMVTIQPWVFITTCWSRQYDFNLVHHPTPEKRIISFSEKNVHQVGFEPGTPTTNPERTRSRPLGYGPTYVKPWLAYPIPPLHPTKWAASAFKISIGRSLSGRPISPGSQCLFSLEGHVDFDKTMSNNLLIKWIIFPSKRKAWSVIFSECTWNKQVLTADLQENMNNP